MWFSSKYLIFLILIIFCILSFNECKEKSRKKSNSTVKPKKRNSTADKLVKPPKSSPPLKTSAKKSKTSAKTTTTTSTTTPKPIKLIRSQQKLVKKSVVSPKPKISKNNVMESEKQIALPTKPFVSLSNGKY